MAEKLLFQNTFLEWKFLRVWNFAQSWTGELLS